MSSFKKLIFLYAALILTLFTSCEFNLLEKRTGEIIFDLSAYAGKNNSSSRNLIDDAYANDQKVFVDVALEGTYQYKTTFNLKEKKSCQIRGIPVGSKIKAIIQIYTLKNPDDPESKKNVLYEGESKTYTIKPGLNMIKIKMGEGEIEIETGFIVYATYRSDNTLSEEEDYKQFDGSDETSGFNYIQNAVNWIIENAEDKKDWVIKLAGYTSDECFDQSVILPSTLNDKVASITFTSYDPENIAIKTSFIRSIFTINASEPKFIFRNIQISSSAFNTNTDGIGLIISMDGGIDNCSISLEEGTVFIGEEKNNKGYHGGAIYQWHGTIDMKDNACIRGFNAYEGGAVYIRNGYFNMYNNSTIENCHSDCDGGAFYTYARSCHIQLNDNSSITGCDTVSGYNGGAAYIYGGDITIESGSITGCKAQHGGAIYLSEVSQETSLYLKGGEIKNNVAYGTKGSAIYASKDSLQTSYIYLYDNASVDLSNDIFTAGQPIKISNSLKKSGKIAMITHDSGTTMNQVLIKADSGDSDSLIEDCHKKFWLRSYDGTNYIYNEYINKFGNCTTVDYLLENTDTVEKGDLVFANNKRARPTCYDYLTYELYNSIAGIVFYAGTGDVLGAVNLIVGTKTYNNFFTTKTSISTGSDLQFNRIQVENYPTYEIPAGGSSIIQRDTTKTIAISEAEFAEGLSTGNTSLDADIIDSILNGYSYNGNEYLLYRDIIKHGELEPFKDTRYTLNTTDNYTNNWYIPTIAEFTLFANFLNDYSDLYTKICGKIYPTYISLSQVWGQATLPMSDTGGCVYYYAIDTEENVIKCVSSSGSYMYKTIPIHVYTVE